MGFGVMGCYGTGFQEYVDIGGIGALHLRVNDVDTAIIPCTCGGSGCDGDASLLFLFHPVHGSSTLVYLSNLVCLTCE
jgi:hypothetical protein